jgi:valyl-tRNA synthetase
MLRQTYGVPPTQRVDVEVHVGGEAAAKTLETFKGFMEKIAKVNAKIVPRKGAAAAPVGSAKAIINSELELVMPLGGLIDPKVESARLDKDIEKANKEIATLEKKLGNADFLAKAAEDVVVENRARLAEEKTKLERLIDALATVKATA